ncbi:hypothetical protein EDB85DRAFT_1891277 [Lactarius pseudohatsudake]|nr:hypothetical protein EDB85DRAFT_1891277 [Lactarius pseudohatsudake]
MFFSRQLPAPLSVLLFVTLLPLAAHGYFKVTAPTKGIEWANGQTYPVTWTKGLLDGVDFVDLELTRMSTDGLILVARDVPSSTGGLNIALNSVPAGDDYFLLVLNSTHGIMYATSQPFSIVDSGSSNSSVQPIASKPTVTVSGGPNPTAQFAATFGSSSGAVRAWHPKPAAVLSACFISLAMFAGAVAVL